MSNVDDLFLTVMGSVILLMQAGFAFLEAGSVRAKNTTNILIKNFADLCFGEIFPSINVCLTGKNCKENTKNVMDTERDSIDCQ